MWPQCSNSDLQEAFHSFLLETKSVDPITAHPFRGGKLGIVVVKYFIHMSNFESDITNECTRCRLEVKYYKKSWCILHTVLKPILYPVTATIFNMSHYLYNNTHKLFCVCVCNNIVLQVYQWVPVLQLAFVFRCVVLIFVHVDIFCFSWFILIKHNIWLCNYNNIVHFSVYHLKFFQSFSIKAIRFNFLKKNFEI